MDTRDGRIYDESEIKKFFGDIQVKPDNLYELFAKSHEKRKANSDLRFFKRMEVSPTEKQLARKPPKVGRNEPCPCGSGKKFKKCCLNSIR